MLQIILSSFRTAMSIGAISVYIFSLYIWIFPNAQINALTPELILRGILSELAPMLASVITMWYAKRLFEVFVGVVFIALVIIVHFLVFAYLAHTGLEKFWLFVHLGEGVVYGAMIWVQVTFFFETD